MRKLYFLSLLWSCAYLLPLQVAANDTCTANFTYSGSGYTVNFQAAPGLSAGTVHWWLFVDGSAGDPFPNPVHTYAAAGTYWVKHYILNQATNCNDSSIKEIKVPQITCSLEPKFSYYRDSLDCRKIHFINTSTPATINVHFLWKFGDGITS